MNPSNHLTDTETSDGRVRRARPSAARQARIRLASDGVVASYIREIAAGSVTSNASPRSGGAQG